LRVASCESRVGFDVPSSANWRTSDGKAGTRCAGWKHPTPSQKIFANLSRVQRKAGRASASGGFPADELHTAGYTLNIAPQKRGTPLLFARLLAAAFYLLKVSFSFSSEKTPNFAQLHHSPEYRTTPNLHLPFSLFVEIPEPYPRHFSCHL